jgi:photosystem II stability/assembly factor-like uncharacterized protein
MKPFIFISIAVVAAFTACRKDPAPMRTEYHSLPFETAELKIEIASENLPLVSIADMCFLNDSTGIICSRDGRVFRTNDRGKTWELKYTNTIQDQPVYQMLFTDANTGYIVAGASWCNGSGCSPPGGVLIKTTDGGKTWQHHFRIGGQVEFVSLARSKNGALYILENGFSGPGKPVGRILRSINGGDTFAEVHKAHYHLQKIQFGGDYGFCAGGPYGAVLVLRSDTKGNNWTRTLGLEGHYSRELAFFGNTGVCITDNSTHMTTDIGESWFLPWSRTNYSGNKVNMISPTSCVIWGYGDERYRSPGYFNAMHLSKDRGDTWLDIRFGPAANISHTSFYNSKEGYALCDKLLKVTIK